MARTYPAAKSANTVLTSTEYNDQLILNLQHLLGYTLDGDDLDSITTPKEIHQFKHRIAPSTPSSGNTQMYIDSADDVLKTKDSAGEIYRLGAGAWHEVALSSGQYDITLTDYEDFVGCHTIEIDVGLRSLLAATAEGVYILFNDVITSSSYYRQTGGGDNNVAIGAYSNLPLLTNCPANSSPSDLFLTGTIRIGGVDKTIVREAIFDGGGRYETAKLRREVSIVSSTSSASLTRIRLRPSGWSANNFNTSSWLRIRFIK